MDLGQPGPPQFNSVGLYQSTQGQMTFENRKIAKKCKIKNLYKKKITTSINLKF